MLFEACVDSVEAALAAQEGGAQRLELCANLLEGGTTPSTGMIRVVKAVCRLPLHVLIRPRGGDFLYSHHEVKVMQEDIKAAAALGAEGVVLGILTADGSVDVAGMQPLVRLSKDLGLEITFHRAFDLARDAQQALEAIIGLGISRVLTSGQHRTALEGVEVLRQLVDQAAGRIIVTAGAGVTEANAGEIVRRSGVRELHGSARSSVRSKMRSSNSADISMSASTELDMERLVTDRVKVHRIVEAAREALLSTTAS